MRSRGRSIFRQVVEVDLISRRKRCNGRLGTFGSRDKRISDVLLQGR